MRQRRDQNGSTRRLPAQPTREEFDKFYCETCIHVFSYCSQLLRDPDAAEEATQQTYVHLWEMLQPGAVVAGSLCATNRRGNDDSTVRKPITRVLLRGNTVEVKLLSLADLHIDRLRKRFVQEIRRRVDLDHALEIPDERCAASAVIERKQMRRRLEELLEQLPSDCRQTVNLYFIDEKTHSEIAAILCLDRTTVTKRIQKAKALLKELLPQSLKEEIMSSSS